MISVCLPSPTAYRKITWAGEEDSVSLHGGWSIGTEFIWDHLKRAGYATMIAHEQCRSWIDVEPTSVPSLPTDHVFQKLFCVSVGENRLNIKNIAIYISLYIYLSHLVIGY